MYVWKSVATINAERPLFRTHLVDRVTKNIDWETVERAKQAEAARRTVERIAELRHIVFRNATRSHRGIEALTNEPAAARLLISASRSADSRLVLGILQVAMDNRWGDVVKAGTRYFREHPVAARIRELWDLTG